MYLISGILSLMIAYVVSYLVLFDSTGNRIIISIALAIPMGFASALLCRAYYNKCTNWNKSITLSVVMPIVSVAVFTALVLVSFLAFAPIVKVAIVAGSFVVVGLLMVSEKLLIKNGKS